MKPSSTSPSMKAACSSHASWLRMGRSGTAVSTGRCNEQLFKPFGWSLPVEGHPGAAVELDGDLVEFVLGVAGQAGAFGEVLAEQPVGVLVGAALPGRVGVAEIDRDAGRDGESRVPGHLAALVPGQRPPQMAG